MPAKDNRRPDLQDMDEALTHFHSVWADTLSNWQTYDTYYWRTFPIWPKEMADQKRPEYRPSTSASIIDHAADTQMAYDPHVKRPVYSRDEDEERDSSLIERFVSAVFKGSGLMEPVYPFKLAGKYLLYYGRGVILGPTLDMSSRPKKPERDKGEGDATYDLRVLQYEGQLRSWNPFRIRAPHPATVFCDPGDKVPDVALVLSTRTVKDLEELSRQKARTRKYAEVFEPVKTMKPYDRVDIAEWWSADWHGVRVKGGQLLYVERNLWGFSPLTQAFAGFGQERMDTNEGYNLNPRWLAVGLLEHIMESLKIQAQNEAAKHQMLIEASFRIMYTMLSAEEVAQRVAGGQIIEGRKDDVGYLDVPQMSQWMFEAGRGVDRDIEQGTYATHVAGMREEGVSTVGQQQILTTQAQKKFVYVAHQLEEIATVTGQNLLRLVEVLHSVADVDKMTVRGNELLASSIHGDHTLEVRFELFDPVMDLQRRQLGMSEVANGLKSDVTYREMDAHIEDEWQERRRLIEMRLRQNPGVMAAEDRLVAREEGLKEVFDEMDAMANEQQQAQAAGGNNGGGPASGGGGGGGNPLRQPLTPDTAKPPQGPAVP